MWVFKDHFISTKIENKGLNMINNCMLEKILSLRSALFNLVCVANNNDDFFVLSECIKHKLFYYFSFVSRGCKKPPIPHSTQKIPYLLNAFLDQPSQ